MRHHPRIPLPSRVQQALSVYKEELADALAENAKATKPRLASLVALAEWDSRRDNTTFGVIEAALKAMASEPLRRCMYCEHDRGNQIDHHEPKSVHPKRTFDWENMLWSCATCNLMKLERYEPGVIDPTKDDPLEHLYLASSGAWKARDGDLRGEVTERVLPLNPQELEVARRRTLACLRRKIVARDRSTLTERAEHEADLHELAVEQPFSDVFAARLRASREPGSRDVLGDAVVDAIYRWPELHTWLPDTDAARHAAVKTELDRFDRAVRIRRRRKS